MERSDRVEANEWKKEFCPICAGCAIDGKAFNTTLHALSMEKL